jgi:prokaryotic ubiquitin-like protein Pup
MPQRETADHRRGRSTDDSADVEIEVGATPQDAALDADVDAILDEIDDVLEVNAEDFVKSFVQKGGQ